MWEAHADGQAEVPANLKETVTVAQPRARIKITDVVRAAARRLGQSQQRYRVGRERARRAGRRWAWVRGAFVRGAFARGRVASTELERCGCREGRARTASRRPGQAAGGGMAGHAQRAGRGNGECAKRRV